MELPPQVTEPNLHLGTRTECNSDKSPQRPPSQDCLKSLGFPEMNHRSNDIESAAQGTCEWLLRHKEYKRWAARDQGLFWIKGKPGSGKSTLLRYALDNVERAPSFRDEDLVLSFFFHGRGNELQKTPLGLFRSLLHQILSHVPDALPNLVANFQNWYDTIRKDGQEYKWHLPELQRFFKSSLPEVLKSRPIWLFVDALDECGEENAASIITDFKSWLQAPSLENLRFRICFTCRHYPILVTDYASEVSISLEHENPQDISAYVRDRLSTSRELTASEIPDLITNRAKGVFLWACLVVKRILNLERKGKGLKMMEQTLDDTPLALDELYNELISSTDEKAASLKMFQWICFAMRPLTLDELRWAMIVDPECREQSLQDCMSMEEYIGDSVRMEGIVKALSCGLAEIVESSNTRVVQFIHQSVPDFLLEEGLSILHDSLAVADINLNNSIVGAAHYRLSRICIRYMAMKEIARSFEEGDYSTYHPRDAMFPAFPLLHYASTSWVAHVKQSEAINVPQEDLLSYFEWPSENLAQLWLRVKNKVEPFPNRLPLRSHLVHIVSQYGLIEPLCMILQRAGQVGADIDAKNDEGRTPLSYAAGNGNETIVKLLVERDDVNVDSRDIDGQTPLSYAAQYGRNAIVKLLIKRDDVNVNSKDNYGRTPLLYAVELGENTIVKLLIERDDTNVDPKDEKGRTPLSHAAERGHEAIVKLLVE